MLPVLGCFPFPCGHTPQGGCARTRDSSPLIGESHAVPTHEALLFPFPKKRIGKKAGGIFGNGSCLLWLGKRLLGVVGPAWQTSRLAPRP